MKRRNFLVGLGGASVAGAAVIGTGAFSRVESQRDVTIAVAEDPDAYLGLDKCNTENGSYAHLDDDGHLQLLMNPDNPTIPDSDLGDGINSDSTTWFHNVFQICNQGKEDVCVWISDDDAWPEVDEGPHAGERRVDFYLGDDDSASLIGEDNHVVLPLGECVCIGLLTRSYGLQEGDEVLDALENEITINADVDCLEDPGCIEEEVLYLTNSRPKDASGNEIPGTELLEVDELSGGVAQLQSLATITDGDFDQVDSLACTPDGETLYFYDKDSGHLGELDSANPGAGITDLGEVSNDPGNVVLGTYSPDGVLYAVSQTDNKVYTVDPSGPTATEVGDTGIDVNGSDIVFDVNTMYLHSNSSQSLYEVDRNTGTATQVCNVGEDLTGLAIREGGTGDIIGSLSGFPDGMSPGEIVQFDSASCGIATTYEMQLDGEDYDYESGDMATGPQCVEIN